MTAMRRDRLFRICQPAVAALCISLTANYAVAQSSSCRSDTEPNDTPEQAAVAAACMSGTLSGEDSQDLWRWQVDDSADLWQLEVDGVPNALTRVEVFTVRRNSSGVATGQDVQFFFESLDGTASSPPVFMPPGEYFVGIATSGGAGEYELRRTALDKPARAESEPNDDPAAAEAVDGAFAVRGTGDTDRFSWTLNDTDAQQRWQLMLRAPLGAMFRLELQTEEGRAIQSRSLPEIGSRSLSELGLDAGTYQVVVATQPKAVGMPYVLEAVPVGPRGAGFEEEPNEAQQPNSLDAELGISGLLDGDPTPTDFFTIENSATPPGQRTTISLRTESRIPRRVCLRDAKRDIQCRSGVGSIVLPDLVLTDDKYWLRINGRPDLEHRYDVSFDNQRVFGDIHEQEPNDAFWHAPALDERIAVRGQFAGAEEDVYRFRAPGDELQLWRIQVRGSGVRRLEIQDARGDEIAFASPTPGSNRIRLSPVRLLPGTHHIVVSGQNSEYLLRALPLGPPDPNVESEPNDSEATAEPLLLGQTRRGVLEARDNDRYRFRLRNRERVRVTVTPPEDQAVRLRFTPATAVDANMHTAQPGKAIVLDASLLPGHYGLWLDAREMSQDAYSISLERLPGFPGADDLDPTLTSALQLTSDDIAAYSTWQQQVTGTVSLTNNGTNQRTVRLVPRPSDAEVGVAVDPGTVTLAPGADSEAAITLTLPPDVQAPVSLQIGALENGRAVAVAEAVVTPNVNTDPASPSFAWKVPEPLRGSIDVSAIGLGSRPVAAGGLREQDLVLQHDQFAAENLHRIGSFDIRRHPLPLSLTTELGGTEPIQVVGFALHPQSEAGIVPTTQQVKDFELQLATDGQNFRNVLEGTIEPYRAEQFFALDQPVAARQARLIVKSNYGDAGRLVLDSWKVLGAPNALPGRVNIAGPAVGGHLVFHDLESGNTHDFASPPSPLVPGAANWRLNCFNDCGPSTFVVGFHSGRAAEITTIEWVEAAGDFERIPSVEVSVSADTPVGPWHSIGTILPGAGADHTHVLDLEGPVLARYVRFEISANTTFPNALPDVVRVIERDVDSEYRSILGEWGWNESVSSQEWQAAPAYTIDRGADGNDTLEEAPLLIGPVDGSVRIGKDEDYYRIDIGESANTLQVDLGGTPTVGASLELVDAANQNQPIALDPNLSTPTQERWIASVTPGASYWLRVLEPPRSVIFVWDTSGSVTPFRPIIWEALTRFSASVTPGRETVNLLPFGVRRVLLDEWQDEPTLIWRALSDHQRARESSDTGGTLLDAVEALGSRSGSRSVVLIGDIANPRRNSTDLWQALALARPHIYIMRVAHSGGPQEHSQLAMQHWAAINAGDARDTPLPDDLEVGFERAAARLRRPASYTLTADQSFREPPGPGLLKVSSRLIEREDSAEPTVLGNTAVEIVLDASGSMRQQLSGKRRIDVAKETLTQLVNDILPPGTPVALRVFGHVEGNYSCRTDLIQPLAPLDPVTASEVIAPIQPQHLAATPIAASLQQVADDLAGASGRKIVILLTDGEETCDGDPAAEIRRLIDRDIDVRLNIVGFALDDAALKATFAEWAETGGGSYFDASDASTLGSAISQALRVPFRVLDGGKEVAQGVVNGDEIQLPAGEYTIEVLSEPPLRREGVVVLGDRSQSVVVESSSPK